MEERKRGVGEKTVGGEHTELRRMKGPSRTEELTRRRRRRMEEVKQQAKE